MKRWNEPMHRWVDRLRRKEVSAVELTHCALARIEALEERIGAFVTVSPDLAIAQAEAVDAARMRGEVLPPLAGIPFALEDNICTRGVRTTCASRMLADFLPPTDATIAERLRAGGAVLVGKANLGEFGMGDATDTSCFGVARNPWDAGRVSGASSSGSAAAVAAGVAFFSVATDADGSIRKAASFCGVVGLKPSYGRISRSGVVAFASSLVQAGPLARNVADAALVYETIVGRDPLDVATWQGGETAIARGADLRGLRLGHLAALESACAQDVQKAWRRASEALERAGAIVEDVALEGLAGAGAACDAIASAEAVSNLGRFDGLRFGHRAACGGDWDDRIAANRGEGFGAVVKQRLLLGAALLSEGDLLRRARLTRSRIIDAWADAFQRYDLLIAPVSAGTAFRFGETPPRTAIDDCTMAVNLAGLPAISVPVGFDEKGLPIGVQIVGARWQESRVFRAAFAVEEAMETRPLPEGGGCRRAGG